MTRIASNHAPGEPQSFGGLLHAKALALMLALVASLVYDLFYLENLGDKSVLLFVAVVQVLSIGLIADLIDKKSRL